MTGNLLTRELAVAIECLSVSDRKTLIAAGIGTETIDAGMIGTARVRVAGDLYEPDPDAGGIAYVTPIRVDNPVTPEALDPARTVRSGEIVDIVAWHPRHPGRWVTRRGAGEWLGAIQPQYLDPDPVAVARSPLTWLRADCRGLVILSRELPAAYHLLAGCVRGIIAEDPRHAMDLRAILARPWPTPRIFVREAGRVE
jgi:hypothetical protein